MSHWPLTRGILKNTHYYITQNCSKSTQYLEQLHCCSLSFDGISDALETGGIAINRKFREVND